MRRAINAFSRLDSGQIEDAATDVILKYVEKPDAYHPEKASLLGYLQMAVRGDLLNLVDRQRRGPRVLSFDFVGNDENSRNNGQRVVDRALVERTDFLADDSQKELEMRLAEILPDPRDREVLRLMADGKRATADFVVVLGIERLCPKEQQDVVRRAKDRIRLRLRRSGLRQTRDGIFFDG